MNSKSIGNKQLVEVTRAIETHERALKLDGQTLKVLMETH